MTGSEPEMIGKGEDGKSENSENRRRAEQK